MRDVRSRFLIAASALIAAASGAAAAPGAPAPGREPSAIHRVGDDGAGIRREQRDADGRGVVVDAPAARVDTRGPVSVDAPGTHVGVHRGHVRVIAPFVDLWIPR